MFFKAIFVVFPVAVAALLYFLLVPQARLGVRARAVLIAFLAASALKFAAFRILGGSWFAPDLPQAVIWVWGWAYTGLYLLLPIALAMLPLRWLSRNPSSKIWLAAPAALAWTLAAAGVWQGIISPETDTIEVEFENLPESLDGYKIAVVSDVHASAAAQAWRTKEIVAKVNALDADLVCLAGDYSDGMSGRQFDNAAPLASIKGRDGVVAVTGNHEYYYDAVQWMQKFHNAGIDFLSNECVFPRPGLAVGGVNDIQAVKLGFSVPSPDEAFASATNGEFRILVQHRPFIDYGKYGLSEPHEKWDLQISGHTHGGVAPVLDRLVALFNGGFVRGLYRLDGGRVLYVSPGSGQWAGFPARFFNPSSITLLVLRKKPL